MDTAWTGPADAASHELDERGERCAENARIAAMLREMAALIEAQGAHPYRVAAYRKAAATVAGLPQALRDIFEREGEAGLDALPAIGTGMAEALASILTHGHWSLLGRLRGDAERRH
jgi:DNA polymerase/3'-5' exonuclease PolX